MVRYVNFHEILKQKTDRANAVIRAYLPKEEGAPARLIEAMNYSMTAGGKRLRPILMEEAYLIFGGTETVIEPFMAGIEMIHTHSLVHDDLPALDNDLLRRGKPTTHAVYGESCAILAGDALLNYAYEIMLGSLSQTARPELAARALRLLSLKTGIFGMLGGQGVDVENDGREITADLLQYIYEKKTAALLEGSLLTGAILAGASDEETAVVEAAAKNIGLAFQIYDDILDVTGTCEELGKPIHSDEKNHKTTYVTLYGLKEAQERAEALTRDAVERIRLLRGDTAFLVELALSLTSRRV